METKIQVFAHDELGKIRTLTINSEVWFVGKDVCDALGYEKARNAITAHVDEEDARKWGILTNGGTQGMTIINESGLYSLILSSKLPRAKEFKRWVTAEVLPNIRKRGLYATPDTVEKLLNDPDFTIRILQEYKAAREENAVLTKQVAALLPKANYCDVVLNCKDLVDTTLIAKDYGMSTREFNQLLHKLGIQFKSNGIWYLYKQYASLGWTKIRTVCIDDNHAYNYTCWTQKGRLGLYEILKRNGYLPMIEIMRNQNDRQG